MSKAFAFGTLVVLAGALAAPATATLRAGSRNIVQVAVEAGSFGTLAKALQAADLVQTLSGPGPFTVFAPTDEAFAKLPAGTLESLLKPENRDTLRRVLTNHVVAGEVRAADVMKLQTAIAVSGDTITVNAGEDGVRVGEARVTKPDIAADNGVIHVIDTVLIPEGL